MAHFMTDLDGDFIDDTNFKLNSPLIYQSDVANRTIEAPAGFVTDFASFQIGMMRIYIAKEASVIHDFCYRTVGFICKSTADRVFLEAMKVTGISWYRRWILYLAVSWFGGSSYKGGVK